MYAIVSTGGKQLKVENGTVIVVEKIDAAPGSVVDLDVVFLADGEEIVVDAAKLAAATVKAEVVEHFKAEKVIVFKFKKRKGYKRTKGHRQQQTRLMVTDILAVGGDAKKAAKAKPVKAEAPAKAPAAKPAAKKAPAKPKAAATPKPKPAAAAQPKAAATPKPKPASAAKPKAAATPKPKPASAAKPKAAPAAKPAAKKAPARKPAAPEAAATDKPKRTTPKKAEPTE